jgi:formate C-acetyltransferase
VSTLFGYFFHVYHGEITGATANGRKRGEPFSDSMGPSQGRDRSGPTAMLNSVLKLDHGGVTGGYALNLKINPSVVRGDAGRAALKALIAAYLEDGGPQVQVNFADAETLRAAKREPEKYGNVIVRIVVTASTLSTWTGRCKMNHHPHHPRPGLTAPAPSRPRPARPWALLRHTAQMSQN